MSVKVVLNRCYGGFTLSDRALSMLREMKSNDDINMHSYSYPNNKDGFYRHDPDLIGVVEQLGAEASGPCAKLGIKEIEGTKYIIREYDGMEWVLEPKDIGWITVDEPSG